MEKAAAITASAERLENDTLQQLTRVALPDCCGSKTGVISIGKEM